MKNKLNEDIDKKIIDCLNNKTEEISASENMFFKIRAEILKKNEGGFLNMKIGRLKIRTMVIAGILCIATTITCVAATKGSYWISGSSRVNEIKQFPKADTVKNNVGYLPKYVENFKGGFKFNLLHFADSSLIRDGKTVIKTKDSYFEYTRDGAKKNQSLFMTANAIDEEYLNEDVKYKKDVTEYKGVKIYYNSIQRKVVPEGYKQTEEESKLIDEGALDMAFGGDEVEEYKSQSVGWYENGISYSIISEDYDDVGKDEMLEMAEAVINK